ncbi:MAG: 6-phosphofructokinase [Ruminococcaceae bacterium]|nr:6-phosphofructokinase [Oscillospiraceae bacterium]
MKEFKKIGVLTSGGDAPGMNAAVRSVVLSALAKGVEVVGIYKGYTGLISGEVKEFSAADVRHIIDDSGTHLYSDRCLDFKTPEGMAKALNTCKELGIDGIVAIGGDGTFRGATDLSIHGIPTIGIPGTIDNDITSTDYTIGFDTALNTTMKLMDNLRDTCESHARCDVIEVMGRNAGWIALEAGIASGAVAIAIGEVDFDADAAIERIKNLKEKGHRSFIVAISETFGAEFSEAFAKRVQDETGVETKFARLAHTVRGGSPTLRDRLTASKMGKYAVDLLLDGKSDLVVCEKGGELCTTEIKFALIVDRMFKNTLKEGDLDKFTPEEVELMRNICAKKQAAFDDLMNTAIILAQN